MEVEKALESLGKWGKWHITNFVILSFFAMSQPSFHMLSIIWISHTPEHHCKLPEEASANDSIPRESNGKLSQCFKYLNYSVSNQTVACDDGWIYDLHDGYSIVNKWDLICENELYSQLPQTVLVLGVMVGAFISSIISDKFGRKPVFMGAQILMVIVGGICSFVGNFNVFLVFRFITGILQQTILLSGFILVSELFSAKQRTLAGINVQCFWGICAGMLAFLAYLIPNWVHLQLTISLMGLLCIPLFWFSSESVPWLYANGKVVEAEKVIRHAAKMNKVQLPDVVLQVKHAAEEVKDEQENSSSMKRLKKMFSSNRSHSHHYSTSYSLLDLVRNRKLLLYLVVSSFSWVVITLVYYGLTLSTGNMEGNRFLNGFYNGIVEIPAYIISYFLINKFGRKKPLISSFMLAATSLFLMAVIPKTTPGDTVLSYLPNVLSIIGKFGITGSFGIIFLYVAELFPTNLRNQAIGIASFVGRLGNLSATFAKYLMKLYPMLTLLVFAGMSFLAALTVMLLPETKDRGLPCTIEEIEAWTQTINVKADEDEKVINLLSPEMQEN